MTVGERRDPEVRTLLFGFDLEYLYLRIDLGAPARQKLAQGLRCSVSFTVPADYRLVMAGSNREPTAELQQKAADGSWTPLSHATPKVAADEVLEAAIAFADLGLRPNTPFAFFVTIHHWTVELERHPAHKPVSSTVPERDFEELNWKA